MSSHTALWQLLPVVILNPLVNSIARNMVKVMLVLMQLLRLRCRADALLILSARKRINMPCALEAFEANVST